MQYAIELYYDKQTETWLMDLVKKIAEQKISTKFLEWIICSTLFDPEALDRARRHKDAFTRNCGKLPYWTMMKLLMKNIIFEWS